MKLHISTSILLAGALLLCACTKTENPDSGDDNKIITFTSTLPEQTQTTWKKGDKIGVFMVRESADGLWDRVVDGAFNKCYQSDDNGVFTAATTADEIKYPADSKLVNFVAYYPYRADLSDTAPCLYPLDMTNQAETAQTNFMVSHNLEGIKVGAGALNLDFKHPLAQIRINISSEFDPSALEGLTVAIHGIKYDKADYALLDKGNKLINTTESEAAIMAITSDDGTLAQATLLARPNGLSANGSFVFSLPDGRVMTHTLPEAVELEVGQCYTYNIELKQSGTTEDFFDILPQQIPDVEVAGRRDNLTLMSKSSWTVKSKSSWITCTPESGKGSYAPQKLALAIGINNTPAREGEIIFEDQNGTQILITVAQKGYSPIGYTANMRYRTTNDKLPDVVEYPSRDILPTDLKWRYYTDTYYNAKLLMEPSSWVNFSYETPRLGYLRPGEQATFNIENNNSSEPREAIVKLVNYDSVLIRVYKIVQQGATDYLEASQNKFNSRGKGDSFDLIISSRNEWQAEQVPSWITLTRGSTSANKTPVNITFAANTAAARSGSIILRSGGMTQTIEVSQNAKKVQSYPFRLPYYAVVHAFAGADFKFVGTSQGTNNYANTADITVIPSDNTSIERAKAYGPYGFVVDPPSSTEFKSTEVYGQTMVVANYSGGSTTIRELEVGIHYNGWTYIRRAKIFNLPVPAGLTEEDKLIYTIKMTNMTWQGTFNYSISYQIK